MKLLLTALVLGALVPLLRAVSLVPVHTPLDVNEGWMAFHTVATTLYPPPGALTVNNYPPLSFYVLRLFVALGVDPIAAGRALSIASLLTCAALVYVILRRLGATPPASRVGSALLVATFLLYTHYVGICDPQLLGHAVSLGGVTLALAPHSRRQLVLGGVLCALALFIKHNLVALPFCAGVWLLRQDARRSAWFLAPAGITVAALLGCCLYVYGDAFVAGLTSPRQFFARDVLRSFVAWTTKLSPLLLAAWLGVRSGAAAAPLCALFCGVALLTGVVAQGGAGVDSNALFEAFIAVVIGAGIALSFARRHVLVLVACAAPFAYGLVRHGSHALRPIANSEEVIAKLRPIPSLCANPTLCFWAGQPSFVDTFNLGQQIDTGARSAAEIHAAVRRLEPRVIHTGDGTPFFLGADVTTWGYTLRNGVFEQ